MTASDRARARAQVRQQRRNSREAAQRLGALLGAKRSPTLADRLVSFVAFWVSLLAFTAFDGVVLMIALDAVHDDWPAVAALGFGTCWIVCTAGVILAGTYRAMNKRARD